MSEEIKSLKNYISTTKNEIFTTFKIETISNLIIYYEDLQQKVEQLEKELQTTANNCKQLENIRKEALKATKDVKQFVYDELVDRNVSGATETHCKIMDLLNILNKGE